jgi:hypothetical protein
MCSNGEEWRETYDEEVVVSITDSSHSLIRNLTNHSIEGKASHRGDGNTLRPGLGIKHLYQSH